MIKAAQFRFDRNKFMSAWCYYMLLIFVAAFFFATSSKQLNNLFYIGLCLPSVWLLFAQRREIFSSTPFFKLFFMLVGWVVVSSLCSGEPVMSSLDELKPTLYLFLLSVLVFHVVSQRPDLALVFAYVLLVSATLSGLLLLYEFYQPRSWSFAWRLSGGGAISNSIWVGGIYGFAALAAVVLFLQQTKILRQILFLFLGLIPFLVMMLSQSRGPMVAFVAALACALALIRNRRSLFIGVLVAAIGILGYFVFSELLSQIQIFRGGSYRLEIWSNALHKIVQAPVIGYGIAADTQNFVNGAAFNHFHNVYLTLAFHSGILGLLLFVLLLLHPLAANSYRYGWLLKPLLIFGMVYMLFNGSRIFTSPKELWLIFWLPLLLLWCETGYRQSAGI